MDLFVKEPGFSVCTACFAWFGLACYLAKVCLSVDPNEVSGLGAEEWKVLRAFLAICGGCMETEHDVHSVACL
jgi:hypothetical protein